MENEMPGEKMTPLTWSRSSSAPSRKYRPVLRAIHSGAAKAGAWLVAGRVCTSSVIAGSGEMLAHSARRLDAYLRKKQGIFEFCDHPHCLLRVAVHRTGENLVLSDASRLHRGEMIAELHLWNEHIPRIPRAGPNLSWAV